MRCLFSAIASASMLALLTASPSLASPVLRYTWGPATAVVVNQDFAGPATYDQTLTITGLSGSVSRVTAYIQYGPAYGTGSAWHAMFPPPFSTVSPPRTDCEGAPGFDVSLAADGATTIPNATLSAFMMSGPGLTDPRVRSGVQLFVTIDPPLQADPDASYAIATLSFHHENSVDGTSPDACDGAELPFCFALLTADATVNGFSNPLTLESPLLSWQNAEGQLNCWDAATPARPASWGAIKLLYR